jgi:NAD(P)H-flavin reductase
MPDKMKNIYYPIDAEVAEIKPETSTIKTFRFKLSEPLEFRAGQFVQLTVPGLGEAPFTPSSAPGKSTDLEITILRTGHVTDYLHDTIKPGDAVGIRGPFGKGYPTDKFNGKTVLVIGGGVGLAPMRAGIYGLFQKIDDYKRVSIKFGARSPEDFCFKGEFDEWAKKPHTDLKLTIDRPAPGWTGTVGVVTVLLDDLDVDIENTYVISCGPDIMLKFVTKKLLDLGFDPYHIYLSMNRRMSCGLGKCHRCNIGPYYICKDGPDMCYGDIMDYPNVFG